MAALAQREFGQTKYWRTCNRPRSEGRVKGFAANSHHPVAILDRPPGGPTEGPTSEKSSMCKLGRASGGTEPHGRKKAEWDGCRHALRPCCRNLCTRQEALNQLQHRVERPRSQWWEEGGAAVVRFGAGQVEGHVSVTAEWRQCAYIFQRLYCSTIAISTEHQCVQSQGGNLSRIVHGQREKTKRRRKV